MPTPLRIRARDLDDYERCPRAFRLTKEGSKGTRLESRSLDRYSVLIDAIVGAHRECADSDQQPDFEILRTSLNRAARVGATGFTPANSEEREEILGMLDIYAELADEMGGTFLELDDPFLERESRRANVLVAGREDLIFDHGDVIEARRISTSKYRPAPAADEFAGEFATHVRTLLLTKIFPGRRIRLAEVNVLVGTLATIERASSDERESGAAILRFAERVWADSEMPPRPNYLCGTCPHLPGCPGITSTRGEEIW